MIDYTEEQASGSAADGITTGSHHTDPATHVYLWQLLLLKSGERIFTRLGYRGCRGGELIHRHTEGQTNEMTSPAGMGWYALCLGGCQECG